MTAADYAACAARYPQVKGIMIGQALAADPFLAGKVKSGVRGDVHVLQEFHDRLFETYAALFDSRPNAMKRMKEMWIYLICSFGDHDRHRKRLMKAKTPEEFLAASGAIFRELPLLDDCVCTW